MNDACDGTDSVLLGREPTIAAKRRWNKADRGERSTMLALSEYRRINDPERQTKAEYLVSNTTAGSGLSPEHVAALLASMMPAKQPRRRAVLS